MSGYLLGEIFWPFSLLELNDFLIFELGHCSAIRYVVVVFVKVMLLRVGSVGKFL
jgi:hypothetical protein